ncbi:MAG: cobalamin biosynthesis protein CbiN [Deltaproteobacteria bacterium]|nr:MAG: cobalamin biosynthesis protein CbiN [Deltaproteobacteria bacterium]
MKRYGEVVWLCAAGLGLLLPAAARAAGTDEQATRLAQRLAPDYRPWAAPLFGTPEGAAESWLFALQAALGLAAIAYCLIRLRRRVRAGKGGTAISDEC